MKLGVQYLKTAVILGMLAPLHAYADGQLTVSPETLDIGVFAKPVVQGSDHVEVANNGPDQIVIQKIVSGCGCVTAELPAPLALPKGKSAKIALKYDFRFGRAQKGLTELLIFADKAGNPVSLKIKYEYRPSLDILEPVVLFPNPKKGAVPTPKSVYVRCPDIRALSLLTATSQLNAVTCKIEEVDQDDLLSPDTHLLKITLSPTETATRGSVDKVTIRARGSAEHVGELDVRFDSAVANRSFPSAATLGAITITSRELMIRPAKDFKWENVEDAYFDVPGIAIASRSAQPADALVLQVNFDSLAKVRSPVGGYFHGVLKIRWKNSDEMDEVAVSGRVRKPD